MTTTASDIAVLGGGSAGYAAALRAAELGADVVLVERDAVGGTCLHRGCIPTKAMLHVAEVAAQVAEAESLGIHATVDGYDPVAIAAFRDGIVDKKHRGLQGLIQARGIRTIHGSGTLLGDGRVAVADEEVSARHIVLATGAAPRILPAFALGERVLTSDGALAMTRIPERAVVIGGGVIGVEFASLWRSLGADVTVVEPQARLVPAEDEALGAGLRRAFARRGIDVRLGVTVVSCIESAESVELVLDDGTTLVADTVLLAVGRVPAIDDIGLERAGVATDRGFVVVDDLLRTTAPGIWAAGDIVPGPQLAHRGFTQGIAVAERIAGQSPVVPADEVIPRVTYTSPELASVGLTRAQAVERYGEAGIESVEVNLAGNARSEIRGTRGTILAIRRVDGPVVGVHMIGDGVSELVTEAQLVIGWDAHPEDVTPFIHAHPTQSEALGEAFLALAGKPLHIR